jgi:hypothetical protein
MRARSPFAAVLFLVSVARPASAQIDTGPLQAGAT